MRTPNGHARSVTSWSSGRLRGSRPARGPEHGESTARGSQGQCRRPTSYPCVTTKRGSTRGGLLPRFEHPEGAKPQPARTARGAASGSFRRPKRNTLGRLKVLLADASDRSRRASSRVQALNAAPKGSAPKGSATRVPTGGGGGTAPKGKCHPSTNRRRWRDSRAQRRAELGPAADRLPLGHPGPVHVGARAEPTGGDLGD